MKQLAVSDATYAYSRGSVTVLFNKVTTASPIECEAPNGTWHDELGGIGDVVVSNGQLRATLPPRSSAILVAK
jgi:hypothetical protein